MSPDVITLLQEGGPVAMSALIFYFYRQERTDKIHYRDIGEENYKEIPKLTMALERLTDEVARRNQESNPPRPLKKGEG